jgi:glycosyltransferase involved in cell wall biosynthesis
VSAAVAILPWGDVVEDFLEPIGLDLDDFAERMTGGWLFGYVAALQAVGRRAVIVCASRHLTETRTLVHAGTGATILAVPGAGVQNPVAWRRAVQQWRLTPFRDLTAILRREGIGAMLVQDYEHARFDALALLGTALRIPIFATFQGGDVTLSRLEASVRPWTLRRLRGVVVASARERARLATRYGHLPLRIVDIPNPLDTAEWLRSCRLEARAELGISEETFLVISHGRIDIHRKGLDVLLDAWRHFSADGSAVRLMLVGSGQDRRELARLLDEAALPGVLWHDEYLTDRVRLRRWLSAADAYVIASRVEGMPVAPLEAMACELPTVSSRAHGLPEIFSDGERSGGILVECGDVAGIATGLRRLRDDPELRVRLGRAGRARVEARFSIAAVGRALDELIRSAEA